MADPVAATITQLKNIQIKTGKSIAELHAAVASSGAVKHGEKRKWLMEQFKLGYGAALSVILTAIILCGTALQLALTNRRVQA